MTLGLYVHVPFCSTRCRYCDFYRVGANGERQQAFVAALLEEIASAVPDERLADSVFLGGGTPSLLSGEEIGATLNALGRRYRFASDVEVSMEVNPSDASPERLAAWRAAGVNRLSLGVQSFNARELRLLGRRHDAAAATQAFSAARRAGFRSISLDLMLAIPGQTEWSFHRTVEQAIDLEPDHLSLYLLEIHRETEFDGLMRTRPGLFPSEEAQRRRYLWAAGRLTEAGFTHYEISNFARPGHGSRHNLKYWRCEPVLGFGPSAHSFDGRRRYRNRPDLVGYLRDGAGREEVVTGVEEERVFLGLRLADGVEEGLLARVAGVPVAEIRDRAGRLAPFVANRDQRLRLTTEGFVVSTLVISRLLEGGTR